MLNFTKVHGNGNDFIVLENLEARYSSGDLARFARLLCRRNFSLGADGILVVESGADTNADFVMRIFNSDGSESDMCGNGARAIARYAFVKGLAKSPVRFTTLAGPMLATVEPPFVELDMGEIDLKDVAFGKLTSHGREFTFVFMIAAIPHCVLRLENEKNKELPPLDGTLKFQIGREVSHDFARFPGGCNVTFAEPLSSSEVEAVSYEMGVEDLTKSCGTGSVATAIALSLRRKPASGTVSVRNPGGVNQVRLDFAADNMSCHAWLKGRTAIVAEGRVLDDAFAE